MDTVYLLPVFETVKLSWQKVKGSKASLWGAYGWVLLIALITGFVVGLLSVPDLPVFKLLSNILEFLSSFVILVLSFGILRLAILRAFERPFRASEVFHTIQNGTLVFNIVCCWLLYMLILLPFIFIIAVTADLGFCATEPVSLFVKVLTGFICGFVTALAIFLMVRIRLAWGYVLDKEFGAWQAIKASFCATRHNFWRLLALYFVNSAIVFLSILPLGLGLIWTLPYVLINYGQVYRQLMVK